MNNGLSLIVPVQVQALCVGTTDAQTSFALLPMANFSTLPYIDNGKQVNRKPYISEDVIAAGGPFGGETALPAGIHLHWALPAGLMRGQQQQDGSLLYPNVPNRWMVTRLVLKDKTSITPTYNMKSWVVESDRLNTDAVAAQGLHQPTVPLDPDQPGQNYRFIGQVFDAAGWHETAAERFENLKAVGYGEAAFASFYPNCCTVFGFYDDMVNADYNSNYDSISYVVAGWYSDPAQDPNAGGIVSGDNAFNWVFNPPTDGSTVNNTVCSGLIENIIWNAGTRYISDDNSPVTVALGSSVQETLSAMMASQSSFDRDTTEVLLNALQFGLLLQDGSISGPVQQFEEQVHEAGFANYTSGRLWQVRKRTTPGTDTNYEGEVTLPDAIAQDLNQLNLQQGRLDKQKEALASKRWQLFSDWYKYLLIQYDTAYTPEGIRDKAEQVRRSLLRQVDAINTLEAQTGNDGALQQSINQLAATISGLIDEQYELANDSSAPRYWQAQNPCMVLYGSDIVPVNRTGEGALQCRVESALINYLHIDANTVPGYPQSVQTFFSSISAYPADAPAALLNAILNDAVIAAPTLQPIMSASVSRLFAGEYYSSSLYNSVLSLLQTALSQFLVNEEHPGTDYLVSTANAYADAPDTLGIFTWNGTPWLPQQVQYDAEFFPVEFLSPGQSYAPEFILENFSWEAGGVELEYNGTTPPFEQFYAGSVILSPDAQVNLAESIRQFMQQTESQDDGLQHALDAVADMPVLAQELSGLMQAMLMREQVLQMKVADPLANSFDQSFVSEIRDAVADESFYSPEPNQSFNPIRTGAFRLQALRLVDAFGQFRDRTISTNAIIAKGLQPPHTMGAAAGTAFLPPRITQPSRLLFRWLSAANDTIESNAHPASSPVIGWVLPDFADNSLFLYNAGGTPLGEIAASADGTSVLWLVAPGGLFPPGTNMATVLEDQLPWLRNFANGIYNNGDPSLLLALLRSAALTAAETLPDGTSNGTASLLTGQPLAITRASLRLEVCGEMAVSESWESFAQSIVPNGKADDAGFSAVQFPVKLGLPGELNDGLFAFWIEEHAQVDFNSFYEPGTDDEAITLTPGAASGNSANILMLVDPKGEVHATTGILPVKSIAIPEDQFGAALNALSVTFLAAPVLSGTNTTDVSFPLPKIDKGRWSWVSASGDGWQTQNFTGDIPNANEAALDYTPQQLREGWLRLRDAENNS